MKVLTHNKTYHYDPTTGIICVTSSTSTREVGHLNKRGYIQVNFRNNQYLAHRLGWYFYHGTWPTKDLDHINGIRNDNRICNLREVSNRENAQNRSEHREGYLVGTRFVKKFNNWTSQITINKETFHLGTFTTAQEAHEAYLERLREI